MPRPTARILILALLALFGSCTGDESVIGVAEQDAPLPRLAGETVDGDHLDAASYADGSVLVINVWADWCAPCRREQPQLVRLADRYEDEGVRFLGINYQDDRDAARAWIEEFRVPYPSLFDPSGRSAADLGFPALPDTYVVDRGGTIRWVVYGETDERELAGLIEDVLA
ncbi:MAG TPA: TlpA disulfide reductase family protein [Actinomycetota bacterium]|nr:TlpA disulfide reductase family protein [Actinomycetota bacterium]